MGLGFFVFNGVGSALPSSVGGGAWVAVGGSVGVGALVGLMVAVAVGRILGAVVSVGVGGSSGSDSSTWSVGVGSSIAVEVEVEVNVAVGVKVGVIVNVAVLVGVKVEATIKTSKGRFSNGSDARVRNLSMNSPDAKSGFVPRIPTKLLTGTLRVSSNNEDNCAATTWSVLATVNIPDAALES